MRWLSVPSRSKAISGVIRDVMLFDRALTEDEMFFIFQHTTPWSIGLNITIERKRASGNLHSSPTHNKRSCKRTMYEQETQRPWHFAWPTWNQCQWTNRFRLVMARNGKVWASIWSISRHKISTWIVSFGRQITCTLVHADDKFIRTTNYLYPWSCGRQIHSDDKLLVPLFMRTTNSFGRQITCSLGHNYLYPWSCGAL